MSQVNESNQSNESKDSKEYTIEELLNRIYDETGTIGKNKTVLSQPQITNKNKKTFVHNFRELCIILKRDELMVMNYLVKETKLVLSISEKGELIIGNILRQPQIDKLFRSFIENFVQCSLCKSINTEFIKKNKIDHISCNKCHGVKSINLTF